MTLIKISGIAVVLAASACASNNASAPPTQTASDQTTTKTTTASDMPTLSSGNVTSSLSPAPNADPVVTHDTKARWTDGQIIGATAAAEAAQEDDAKLARERSKTARVERFAQQIVVDQRDLDAQQARLARAIPASTSEIRSQVDDVRRGITEAARSTSATFDRDFLEAQTQYAKKMISLIDNELIPSATSAELKSYLQSMRSKLASRLLQAQEITTQLP